MIVASPAHFDVGFLDMSLRMDDGCRPPWSPSQRRGPQAPTPAADWGFSPTSTTLDIARLLDIEEPTNSTSPLRTPCGRLACSALSCTRIRPLPSGVSSE